MEQKNQLSNYQILFRGQMHVNVPAILINLLCFFGLTIFADLSFKLAVIIGFILSWIYWSYAIKNWIKWAVEENNIDQERLYKIGKYGLLLWNRDHIKQVIENKKKPWI